ncbi:low molecular weight protein-tyrosine-phosphatase [Candidatus Symbiobacter mobilis]|uniref:protein-tyrosine-phosphatase n=1 Tax=Candidatus Symbiobacter mobilis CR TaxID=946483 RepID=U5NDL6_9BURK|nr:low molecular weight protein-tyrosine-phosphatase [Candidatus Symbiobacter mobilis]AGX88259.1 protein-tyrosine phosphatase [Candidatus Symbiobacter mobilis CR]
MTSILTLCLGNICRSPLAQVVLARQLLGHSVSSAGLSAMVGYGADPLSIEVAQAHGLDLRGHRAQQVTLPLCQQADLILVMEETQRPWLEQRFPIVRGKVFRIGHYGGFDVEDPYGKSFEEFERAYAAIVQGAADWVERIHKL